MQGETFKAQLFAGFIIGFAIGLSVVLFCLVVISA